MPNNKQTIHNPHDKALFHALKNREIAKDAIQAYVPEELLKLANLNEIKRYITKLISPEYKAFEADVIYQVPLQNQNGLFLLHFEHQSHVQKNMPLRIWQYLLLILMEYTENYPQEALPIVYPIILYTGEAKYNQSTNLFDLFGNNKNLAENYLLNDINLIDICRMSDDDIKKHQLFGLSEFAFKHKKTKNFKHFLMQFMPWLDAVEFKIGPYYAKIIIRYVLDVFPEASYDVFAQTAKQHLSEQLGDEAMTIAQQLRQEGRQEGRQVGRQEGMHQGYQRGDADAKAKIAVRLLAEGLSIKQVEKITEVPMDSLEKL